MSNNIKNESVTTNEVNTANLAGLEVGTDEECLCPVCRGFTPSAYINNEAGSYYEFPVEFYTSEDADVFLKEVLEYNLDEIDDDDRYEIFDNIIEEIGLMGFILEFVDAYCSAIGIEWSVQLLSECDCEDKCDCGEEYNILYSEPIDYSLPYEFIFSSFITNELTDGLTPQQNRFHIRKLGEYSPLFLAKNFLLSLCHELGVYIDTQFDS